MTDDMDFTYKRMKCEYSESCIIYNPNSVCCYFFGGRGCELWNRRQQVLEDLAQEARDMYELNDCHLAEVVHKKIGGGVK